MLCYATFLSQYRLTSKTCSLIQKFLKPSQRGRLILNLKLYSCTRSKRINVMQLFLYLVIFAVQYADQAAGCDRPEVGLPVSEDYRCGQPELWQKLHYPRPHRYEQCCFFGVNIGIVLQICTLKGQCHEIYDFRFLS